jgi:heme oxygenase-like protein
MSSNNSVNYNSTKKNGQSDHKVSFSSILRFKLNVVSQMGEVDSNLQPLHDASTWFKNYLFLNHSIIRSSVPLMQAAHKQCKELQNEEELMIGLAKYYEKHSFEELYHDEWLLEDLESIGIPRKESLSREPSQSVAELVGSQYYWIYHWHPVCLIGYISFLEGNPPTKQSIDQLQEATGYPKAAFRTLLKHSDLDPHHRDDLNDLLDLLPLTERHKEWITCNALYSANKILEVTNSTHN